MTRFRKSAKDAGAKEVSELTCGGCDNTWTGVSRCHCSACHQTFGGISTFDQHRKRDSCLQAESLGLENVAGVWKDRSVEFDASVFAREST